MPKLRVQIVLFAIDIGAGEGAMDRSKIEFGIGTKVGCGVEHTEKSSFIALIKQGKSRNVDHHK